VTLRLPPEHCAAFEETTDILTANQAQNELLKLVRSERVRESVVLWEIERMLDPKGRSFWKLELKQRRRGKHRIPLVIIEDIVNHYHLRVNELRKLGATAPIKIAVGELAEEYKMSDAAIRELVRRTMGKKSGKSQKSKR
jgi:hypothetical protein